MARLTKAQIEASDDLKVETVEVPEWGGEVVIRAWSVDDSDRFAQLLQEGQETGFIKNFRANVAAMSIVDEAGDLMFTPEEVTKLGKKSPAAMNRVHLAALKLNGLQADAVEDEEAESEKN
jgi:hypothetical protein